MKIKFADTFSDSIKKLMRRRSWWYKSYSLFRYDLPRFLGNIWRFRKALWNHYWWDHHAILQFMDIGFEHMAENSEKYGFEIDISRLKKVKAMRRASELIRNYNDDLYIEIAESELGKLILNDWEFEDIPDRPGHSRLKDKDTPEEKEHNSKIFARANEIQEAQWVELWSIIKGQDHHKYTKMYEFLSEDEKRERDHYYHWFDGTGLRGWWD